MNSFGKSSLNSGIAANNHELFNYQRAGLVASTNVRSHQLGGLPSLAAGSKVVSTPCEVTSSRAYFHMASILQCPCRNLLHCRDWRELGSCRTAQKSEVLSRGHLVRYGHRDFAVEAKNKYPYCPFLCISHPGRFLIADTFPASANGNGSPTRKLGPTGLPAIAKKSTQCAMFSPANRQHCWLQSGLIGLPVYCSANLRARHAKRFVLPSPSNSAPLCLQGFCDGRKSRGSAASESNFMERPKTTQIRGSRK